MTKIVIQHINKKIKYICDYIAEFDTEYYKNTINGNNKTFYDDIWREFAPGDNAPFPDPAILADYIANLETKVQNYVKNIPKIKTRKADNITEYIKEQEATKNATTAALNSDELEQLHWIDINRFAETAPAELNILIGAETGYSYDYDKRAKNGYDQFNIWIGNIFYNASRFIPESKILGLSIDMYDENLKKYLDFIRQKCGCKIKSVVFAFATLAYFYEKSADNSAGFVKILNHIYDLIDDNCKVYLEASAHDVDISEDFRQLFMIHKTFPVVDLNRGSEYLLGHKYVNEEITIYKSNTGSTYDELMKFVKKSKTMYNVYNYYIKKLYIQDDDAVYYSNFLYHIMRDTKFNLECYCELRDVPYPVLHNYTMMGGNSIQNNYYIVLKK